MPGGLHAGDLLAGRYLVADLLDESRGGRFWRAEDQILQRHVAVHVIAEDDERAEGLLEAARLSATVHDRRILRVLDADRGEGHCYVVNEWGAGASLDIMLARDGPLPARRAAWIVAEAAAVIAAAHAAGVSHGRLAPENVLIDHHGAVRIIGLAVEAALWGLPQGRTAVDVTDLGGVLYAALTGRWAGISRSSVPPAHQIGGRVLRPRKVRAGIPRLLDDLCDEVLNPPNGGTSVRSAYDLATARGIADALTEFVGDPTGLVVAEPVSTLPVQHHRPPDDAAPTAVGPPEEPGEPGEPEGTFGTATEVEPTVVLSRPAGAPDVPAPDGPETSGPLASVDQPTQAGMPIFDDERDEVAWIAARSEKPPPPPPFEAPQAKPLFAPAPPEGQPLRKPRPGAVSDPGPGYWPWDGTGAGGRSAPGTSPGVSTTGSGVGIIGHDGADEDADGVPGRSWMRLAAGLGACVLLLLATVFAFNLGQGRSPLQFDAEATDPPTETSSESPAPRPVTGATATDLDPQGEPPEENPDLAPLTVDGNPTTAWRTQTYAQQLGPAGLKTGVGIVVDLGAVVDVRRVRVDLLGEPTGVTLFLTSEPPTAVVGLEPLVTEAAGTRLDVAVEGTGRYLVVWLTALPEVEGGFRGEIAEVLVRA